MNTTLADIVLTAQAAANKAVKAPDALAQHTIKLEEFATANLDRADFPTWEQAFNAQLDMLTNFAKQDSPATAAAKKVSGAGFQPASPKA